MSAEGAIVEKGKKAPALRLADEDGRPRALADFKGRWVVLYFYPLFLFPFPLAVVCWLSLPIPAGDPPAAGSPSGGPARAADEVPLSLDRARIYEPGEGRRTGDPLRLGPGPHLFIDDLLVERSEGIERKVQPPARDPAIPDPIVTGKEDGCFQPYLTVLRDPAGGRFRIWYGCRTEGRSSTGSHIGHLESDDGIRWKRPHRVLSDPAPIQFGTSVIDEGAGASSPDTRYKLAWWMDGGLRIAGSPDGLVWKPLAPGVVLRHNHDINGIFLDPLRRRTIAIVSVYIGGPWKGQRRVTMQAESRDLLSWSAPHHILVPRPGIDDGETQFYAMDGFLVRGDLLIGMVKVLRDDLKADAPPDPPDAYGVGLTALAWTRDGETWVRDRAPFFDRDPRKGAWDHAHAWIDEQVPVGGEVYLYYAGYARGHKVNRFEERQIGLVRMPRDRYVARAAGDGPGLLVTPPFVLDAGAMTVNVDARGGEARAEVLDESGRPVRGFGRADGEPIAADALDAPVRWKRPLAELRGSTVRLAFHLVRAKLFAFDLR